MIVLHRFAHLVILAVALYALPADAQSVDETSIGEAVERHLSDYEPFQQWMQQGVPSGLLTGAIIALVVQVVAYGLAAAIAMQRLRSRI